MGFLAFVFIGSVSPFKLYNSSLNFEDVSVFYAKKKQNVKGQDNVAAALA